MKNIHLFLFILVLSGCNNNEGRKAGNSTKEPDTNQETTDVSTAEKKEETLKNDNSPAFKDPLTDSNKTPADQTPAETNPTIADANQPTDSATNTVTKLTGKSSGTGNGKTTPPAAGEANDTIVYVGVFARWDTPGGEQYDGSYDQSQSLFVLCSNHHCLKVPFNEVVFQKSGSCDTALGDRIKAFKKKRDGTFQPLGSNIKVTGNRGIIQAGPILREIQLDKPTIKRIEKAYIIKQPAKLQDIPSVLHNKNETTITEPSLKNEVTIPAKQEKHFVQPDAVSTEDRLQKVETKTFIAPAEAGKNAENKIQAVSPLYTPPVATVKEAKPAFTPATESRPALTEKTLRNSPAVVQPIKKDTVKLKSVQPVKPIRTGKFNL